MTFGMVREPAHWPLWPQARALLAISAEKGGDVTIEAVEASIMCGASQLWATEDATFAGVTQIVPVNGGLQCFIWQMAGEGDWPSFLPMVEDFARAQGCVSIEGNMRPGFERTLTDWKKVAVTLRKELA